MKSLENLVKKKLSGGRRIPYRGRRAYEVDRYSVETLIGPTLREKIRVRGGLSKIVVKRIAEANVFDPTTKKGSNVKILKVVKNISSRDYERRGVLTKGAIIETGIGRARVVSRPGQHGIINAILLK